LANSEAELRVLIVEEARRQAILAAQARARMIAYQAAQQRAAQVRAAQASPQPSSAGSQGSAPVAAGPVAAPSGAGAAVPLPSPSGSGSSAAPAPSSGSVAAPSGSGTGSAVVNYALQFLGTPYKWGGSGPGGFDCSGFTSYVYSKFGVNLQHYTGAQGNEGAPGSRNDLPPGDLVFFHGDSHRGLHIAGGTLSHPPPTHAPAQS